MGKSRNQAKNQQTSRKPEPKSDTESQPINNRLSVLLTIIGAVLGAIAAAFGSDHPDPMVVFTWLAVAALSAAAVYHWPGKYRWHLFSGAMMLATAILGILFYSNRNKPKINQSTQTAFTSSTKVSPSPTPQTAPTTQSRIAQVNNRPLDLEKKVAPKTINSSENYLSDFRVYFEQNQFVSYEVWYFYNGAAGKDDVAVYMRLLDANGHILKNGFTENAAKVAIINTRAITKGGFQYFALTEMPEVSTSIELCMQRIMSDEYITCSRFPFKRTWKMKPPKP